jgi:hypothetical protein
MESPFLYEQAHADRGHLIVPFQYAQVSGYPIYSYALLSALGHRGALHQAVNPAQLYSISLDGILDIAQEHLVQKAHLAPENSRPEDSLSEDSLPKSLPQEHLGQVHGDRPEARHLDFRNAFRQRYIYRGHLLIVGEIRGRYFYDHYSPYELRNIAAPKLFASESECLSWIKLGLDRRPARP